MKDLVKGEVAIVSGADGPMSPGNIAENNAIGVSMFNPLLGYELDFVKGILDAM